MKLKMAYLIGHFGDEIYDIVPSTWVANKDETYWPPFQSNETLLKAVKEKIPVNPEQWKKFRFEVMGVSSKLLIQIYLI